MLAAGEGRSAAWIAEEVGCSERTVWKWRRRYERDGLAGLLDAPRPGRPLVHGPQTRARLIALACTRPSSTPEGLRRERWTHRELAEAVGMSESQAHEILRAAEIKPHLLEQWVMSDLGPEFDAQAATVCGLYLNPPEGTLVVSLDEKTGIQAKAPTRADLQARPARPARREHEYRRNGTQNLFAALRVHSGEVSAMPSKTRNRYDLLRFLDQLEREIPAGEQVIAISDNLSTRRTQEVSDWLAEHPRWRFVFTPSMRAGSTRSRPSSRSSREACANAAPSQANKTSPSRCSPSSRPPTKPPVPSNGHTPAKSSPRERANQPDRPLVS